MKGQPQLLLLLLLAMVFVLVATVRGAAVTYTYYWTVDYAFKAPDCVEKQIISINGSFPGPTVRVTVGDTVVVNVQNKMPTEGLVIHWHGILQKRTPWADGAAYVSQCPINPQENYTYIFVAERAGTYIYHGHYGMQRSAGLYGSLIVDPAPGTVEPFTYDGELSILLGDWWHKPVSEQESGLSSNPLRWVGEPQSLLIQGRGAYNCSWLTPTSCRASPLTNSSNCLTCNISRCAPHVLPVEAGKTYRLRIASLASLSSLNFILEGHNLTVVEVSGHYVEPVVVQNLDVYSGQAVSILFTANQDPSRNYWAAINVRGRNATTPTGLAVLNYLPNPNTSLPTTIAPVSPAWNNFNLSLANAQVYKALAGYREPLPNRPTDRHIFLLGTQNLLNGLTKWAINNVTYVPTSTPVLAALKYNLTSELVPTPPDTYNTSGYNIYDLPPNTNNTNAGSGVYTFQLNDVVDVILQSGNMLNNISEIHPWHLHGHDFWVLGYGLGVFNEVTDYPKLNYWNPPRMNTAAVFPHGWTYLRFVADNPGAWPFHCHVDPHFHMGMGVVFAVGVNELPSMRIPEQNFGCGLTKGRIP